MPPPQGGAGRLRAHLHPSTGVDLHGAHGLGRGPPLFASTRAVGGRVRRRVLGILAAVAVAAGLVACGSNDNGGVIQGPTGTTAPGSTATAAAPSSSGY